jgi:hypothetical protein
MNHIKNFGLDSINLLVYLAPKYGPNIAFKLITISTIWPTLLFAFDADEFYHCVAILFVYSGLMSSWSGFYSTTACLQF